MRIEVLLFASLRDRAGSSRIAVDLGDSPTVSDLRAAIAEQHPRIADGLSTSRIAVDLEFRDDAFAIAPGSEVAVIPPVSGG